MWNIKKAHPNSGGAPLHFSVICFGGIANGISSKKQSNEERLHICKAISWCFQNVKKRELAVYLLSALCTGWIFMPLFVCKQLVPKKIIKTAVKYFLRVNAGCFWRPSLGHKVKFCF